MRLVIIESPYAGDIEANTAYARAAMWDCLERGEAPFASHLLYTQVGVLDDSDPVQRQRGIAAGLLWGKFAEATVVYTDRGISAGMHQGIDRAIAEGRLVVYRSITGQAATPQMGQPPEELLKLTFAVQHNPNCPSPWLVRLPGKGPIDMLPYGDPLGLVRHQTGDVLGFGKTFAEAARAALATATEVAE